MSINKVIVNGQVKVDLTDTTATVSDIKAGKIFYDKNGVRKIGTMTDLWGDYLGGSFDGMLVPNGVTVYRQGAFPDQEYTSYYIHIGTGASIDGYSQVFYPGWNYASYNFNFETMDDLINFITSGPDSYGGSEGNMCDITGITLNDENINRLIINPSHTSCIRGFFRPQNVPEYIYLGENITSIGINFFTSSYGESFTLHCAGLIPPSSSESFNFSVNRIVVPDEAIESYKNADYWCEYSDYIIGETEANL